jgi:hypothetical protein
MMQVLSVNIRCMRCWCEISVRHVRFFITTRCKRPFVGSREGDSSLSTDSLSKISHQILVFSTMTHFTPNMPDSMNMSDAR